MSKWTHLICKACWEKKRPGETPTVLIEEWRDEKADPCCYCGRGCQSGIYIRDNPSNLLCQGRGGIHG